MLRYLRVTTGDGLAFKKTQKKLVECVDADRAGDLGNRRLYTGCFFFLAGAMVSWETRKQRIVALSCTEAGYMAWWHEQKRL